MLLLLMMNSDADFEPICTQLKSGGIATAPERSAGTVNSPDKC